MSTANGGSRPNAIHLPPALEIQEITFRFLFSYPFSPLLPLFFPLSSCPTNCLIGLVVRGSAHAATF